MSRNDPFDGPPDEPAFRVIEAVREAVPSLTALWGFSDSGKTYSALRYARGLVGPKGKIVGIDTENKRMKFYAGMFGGFGHIDLQPPFSPHRYTAAVETAVQNGADAIIIDSASHVWQGEGGVLEQADATNSTGLRKWQAPKTAYVRMVNRMLRSPVHMIFCLRAKEHYVQKGAGKQAEVVHLGQIPIFGAGFIYEMTVAIRMESGSRTPLTVKAPDPIADVIAPGEFITEKHGERIAAWLAGGTPVDHELTALQASARNVATAGSVKVREWWQALTKVQRKSLEPMLPELRDLATTADTEAAKKAQQEEQAGPDPLADAFTPERQAA
jgi:hypothetical protein